MSWFRRNFRKKEITKTLQEFDEHIPQFLKHGATLQHIMRVRKDIADGFVVDI
jgi:hypothetical protein